MGSVAAACPAIRYATPQARLPARIGRARRRAGVDAGIDQAVDGELRRGEVDGVVRQGEVSLQAGERRLMRDRRCTRARQQEAEAPEDQAMKQRFPQSPDAWQASTYATGD